MFSFEVTRSQKNAKWRKIERPTKWLSWIFLYFSILTPKIKNVKISKIITYTIKISIHPKNRNIRSRDTYKQHTYTKFQGNIFVSGYSMAKKPGKGDDVTFLKCSNWPF